MTVKLQVSISIPEPMPKGIIDITALTPGSHRTFVNEIYPAYTLKAWTVYKGCLDECSTSKLCKCCISHAAIANCSIILLHLCRACTLYASIN